MATATVTKPTLTYFNLAGRGEVPRLILEDAGVDYDFVTITNWAEVKPHYIESGKTPFGQLPLYEEPGLGPLVQSNAIVRYLAKKHGYNGSNDHEEAHIDQANEGVTDLLAKIVEVVFRTPEEQRPQAIEKFNQETLPAQLAIFSKLLEKNGNNGHLVGSKLSYADLSLWGVLKIAFKRMKGTQEVCEKFANITSFVHSVESRDRIKAYLARDVYAQHS